MNNKKHIHNQISLFMVVILYKVTMYTELVKTEPLLLGEIQDQVPACLWSHFPQLINIYNLVLCVLMFIKTSF